MIDYDLMTPGGKLEGYVLALSPEDARDGAESLGYEVLGVIEDAAVIVMVGF